METLITESNKMIIYGNKELEKYKGEEYLVCRNSDNIITRLTKEKDKRPICHVCYNQIMRCRENIELNK